MKQAAVAFRTWGGKRKGAGRKAMAARRGVGHRRRPVVEGGFPVHVTWRVREGVWGLRPRRCFGALARAFWGGANRFGFRLVHYSVQGNHMHPLVEGGGEGAVLRGGEGGGRGGRQ